MDTAEKLTALTKLFIWDGDLMRCRACKYAIHITNQRENMRHKYGCKNTNEIQPWGDLRDLIATTPPKGETE